MSNWEIVSWTSILNNTNILLLSPTSSDYLNHLLGEKGGLEKERGSRELVTFQNESDQIWLFHSSGTADENIWPPMNRTELLCACLWRWYSGRIWLHRLRKVPKYHCLFLREYSYLYDYRREVGNSLILVLKGVGHLNLILSLALNKLPVALQFPPNALNLFWQGFLYYLIKMHTCAWGFQQIKGMVPEIPKVSSLCTQPCWE